MKFGDIIEFDEIFGSVLYLNKPKKKDFVEHKIYDHDFDSMDISQGEIDLLSGRRKFSPCMRKIQFLRQKGSGIIIGQTTKQEGIYDPGVLHSNNPMDRDWEPAMLHIMKVYPFWKVATGMNKIVLVPKNPQ